MVIAYAMLYVNNILCMYCSMNNGKLAKLNRTMSWYSENNNKFSNDWKAGMDEKKTLGTSLNYIQR